MPGYTKIVSANYNDRGGRNTKHPWLIRDFGQPPEKAVPAKAVLATGVDFCPSTDYERGFGCSTVAFCKTAIAANNVKADGVPVSFLIDGFYRKDTRDPIESCEQLILAADGSMYATLKAATAEAA